MTKANPRKSSKTNNHAAHKNIDAVAASAHEAIDWAAEASNNAADSLSDTGHEIRKTQEKWLTTAREYVQDNPTTSVGIALASGYLLSRILRTR